MTWANRLRLYGGLVAVIALVAVLTLVFNQRQASATSRTAEVQANQFTVASDYAGILTNQNVRAGQPVTKGQKLFTIQSVALQQVLANGLKVDSGPAVDVDTRSGTLTFKAVVDGTVGTVDAQSGSYIASGVPVVTVVGANSQYVKATYRLSPSDYARVANGASAEIVLPNHTVLDGKVTDLHVSTVDGEAQLEAVIDSSQLKATANAGLSQPGTPVSTTLHLRDDSFLAGPSDTLFGFLRKIGLK